MMINPKSIIKAASKNRKMILRVVKATTLGLSGFFLFKNRHRIDDVLYDTYEDRHSDDDDVRHEANVELAKEIGKTVAPSIALAVVGGAADIALEATLTGELVASKNRFDRQQREIDKLTRALHNNTDSEQKDVSALVNKVSEEHPELRPIIKDVTEYFFSPTGEKVLLSSDIDEAKAALWRANKEIERAWLSNNYQVTLTDIKYAIGLEGGDIDSKIVYMSSESEDPPSLRLRVPDFPHGENHDKLMWEIIIEDCYMIFDADY